MVAQVTDAPTALARAYALLGKGHPYILGTGNHRGPTQLIKSGKATALGFDCWGFAGSYAYEQPRHDPGFNRGKWATVVDYRNCDSAIEEAEHVGAAYEVIDRPEVGCLLVMPSIRDATSKRVRIGHVWMAAIVPDEWDVERPDYSAIVTLQCQASSRPAIKIAPGPKSDARSFRGRTDDAWRIRMLRVVG